ncbi:MAG: trehalose-phosphatase [Acidobacteriota bacterium]
MGYALDRHRMCAMCDSCSILGCASAANRIQFEHKVKRSRVRSRKVAGFGLVGPPASSRGFMMKLKLARGEQQATCEELAATPVVVLLLDLDGTLIPFAPTPEAATLDAEAIALLEALDRADVDIAIVSGRSRAALAPFAELVPHARWIAEHGTCRREPDGSWVGPAASPELDALVTALAAFEALPGVRLERKAQSLCLHWRLVPDALKEPLIRALELVCDEWLETQPAFERLPGVELLEIRRCGSHKGLAVEAMRVAFPGARMIAIGDDVTDDDMFRALRPGDLAIAVGARPLQAACSFDDPAAVRAFLSWFVDARTNGATKPFPHLRFRSSISAPVRSRLVVVSNRIPGGVARRERNVGGLVSALEPALQAHDGIWLGWSGGESAGERRLAIDDTMRPVRASFDLAPTWRERFYGGFCNRALWPLFHGFPGRVSYSDDDWLAYVDANADYASHAAELAAADGAVWLHDYHLLLAGRGLRQRGFRGPVGLFLHVPFPALDLFETLPWATELIEAMLDLDLIGFHTEHWAANFRSCARELVPDRPLPEIAVLPIGIDPSGFVPDGTDEAQDIAGLRRLLQSRRMILGVDRLDYSKGIPERLLGFERLLERRPEWRGQVSFVQISVPSRADVPEYAELRHRVENLVGRINGRFGEADWVPVRYLYRSYERGVLAQLYRAAAVALVTPLRDGLNLVAKEFVASQDPESPGVLVLSRFAGAAAELEDAVITNPYHPDGLAGDLDRALRMDLEERRRRHARLAAVVAGRTPDRWAAAFHDRLATAHRASADATTSEAASAARR